MTCLIVLLVATNIVLFGLAGYCKGRLDELNKGRWQ